MNLNSSHQVLGKSNISAKNSSNPFELKTLQVEITTKCNFECKMCLHAQNSLISQEMSIDLFEKIAESLFPTLEHLILYGVGEPLTHPDFLSILQISRKFLPHKAKLEFTTNGSLLTSEYLNLILQYHIDRIIVSIDSPFIAKIKQMREGFTNEVFDNLIYLANEYHAGKIGEIAIETIISKENLYDLPFLIDFCSKNGIPQIFFSHLLPYTNDMERKSIFLPISEEAFRILDEIGKIGWEILDQIILTPKYHKILIADKNSQNKKLLQTIEMIKNKEIELDLHKITDVQTKKYSILEAKKMFTYLSELAEQKRIKIDLPPLFAESTKRECPFAARNALFITYDGSIIPCYNFGHEHSMIINHHERIIHPYILGSIADPETSCKKVLETTQFHQLHSILTSISTKVPYCGDCVYSTQNCYYISDNTGDCYGNQPGCNECPYSTGFVKCLFDFNSNRRKS
ncbi:MAG: radical SAM/SPASM domain-containing protein [Promethearchaeota archaeon]